MAIKQAAVWPVNELGEIVATAGTGSSNVVGYVNQDSISIDESTGKVPFAGLTPASQGSYDVAALGDSITFQNTDKNPLLFNSIGYMTWYCILNDQKPNFEDALNFGAAGDTSANLLARMDAAIAVITARNCKRAVLHIGTNDLNGGVPVATYISNVSAIIAKLKAAGIDLVVIPILPRSFNTSAIQRAALQRMNNALRVLVRSLPGIRWADPSLAFADNVTDANAFPRDGTDTPAANVTASFSGTTMTVTATANGVLAKGMSVAVYASGVRSSTFPQVFITDVSGYNVGTGTGTVVLDTTVTGFTGSNVVQASSVSVTSDKLHPAPTGGQIVAKAISAVTPDWNYYPAREFVAQTDTYDATNNPTGSMFFNPMMAGSVALPGTNGITGVLATNFTLTRGAGTNAGTTAVCSKDVVQLDNGGTLPVQKIVFTAAAGEKASWTLAASKIITPAAGTKISCWIKLSTSAITPGAFAAAQLRVRDGSSGTSIGNQAPTSVQNYQPNAAWSGKIRAPDYQTNLPANIANEFIVTLDGTANASGASVTITISQFGGIIVG